MEAKAGGPQKFGPWRQAAEWERMREQGKEGEWGAQSRGGVGQAGDSVSHPQESETLWPFL